MARTNVDGWIVEEHSSDIISTIDQTSAVQGVGRREPMGTDTKEVNRSGDVGIAVTAKGSAYNEEQPTGDQVELKARKFTALIRIAEEDIADLPASGVTNYVRDKQKNWASSFAKAYDNAALGVTAIMNGTTKPFNSVYYTLTQADSGAGYTANANLLATAGAVTYAKLSSLLGLIEGGPHWDPGKLVVIAHPSFNQSMRDLLDDNHRPVFDGNGGADGGATLFGLPLRWSLGAKTSATMSKAPSGNSLIVVANRDHLIVGDRSRPEYAVISGWDGASAVTDEALIKMRARQGFVVGDPKAVAVLEVTAS